MSSHSGSALANVHSDLWASPVMLTVSHAGHDGAKMLVQPLSDCTDAAVCLLSRAVSCGRSSELRPLAATCRAT